MQSTFGKFLTEVIDFSKRWSTLIFISVVLSALLALFSDYNLATGTGNLCIVLFVLGNTYIPAKRLRFVYNFKNVEETFNLFLRFHCIVNIAAFSISLIHAYVAHWVNFWLQVSLVLMGWLTFGGFFLKFNYSSTIKKGIYFLHSQQIIFYLMLFALLRGHYVI